MPRSCALSSATTWSKTRPTIAEIDAVNAAYVTLFGAYTASMLEHFGRIAGRAPRRELVEAHTLALAELGRGNTSADYLGAVTLLQRFSRTIARILRRLRRFGSLRP